MAAGMSSDADPARLADGLGTRWALAETSFKFHASCRHTHPAADALQQVMRDARLRARATSTRVTAHVHQGAIDVLGPVVDPQTVHQAKFSMGTVLGLVALHGHAGPAEFDAHYRDADGGRRCATGCAMELDAEVDARLPGALDRQGDGQTTDGRALQGRVDEPKGDPGNTLDRAEIEAKALRLAAFAAARARPRCARDRARSGRSPTRERVPRFFAESPR